MELDQPGILTLLAEKNEAAFEQVFKQHFKSLHGYACAMLTDPADAEEAVQQVFLKLWERPEQLHISGSLAAYLYRAVHNQCLNQIKHQKVKTGYQLHVAYSMNRETDNATGKIAGRELETRFQAALAELPEQCRTIFQLSRFDEMKYREIAETLGISIKTVENQMGKALKLLRAKLAEFLLGVILFFMLK
ncbi:MAG: RNA polymerase sigma-70 factor [Dinghuibacter sp.]|nr:RNA polymerase sigma-70 factor [Dinghuibacter sp.]